MGISVTAPAAQSCPVSKGLLEWLVPVTAWLWARGEAREGIAAASSKERERDETSIVTSEAGRRTPVDEGCERVKKRRRKSMQL